MVFDFHEKDLLYRMIAPSAHSAGLKIYILQPEDDAWSELDKRRKAIGLPEESITELRRTLEEDYPYVCVIRSKTYLGPTEVARPFSKFKVTGEDVQFLTSKNAKKDKIWGDLSAKNNIFLYYIPINIDSMMKYR